MPSFLCDAILFDMDGTLVDSTHCVETIWRRWAERHGVDLGRILACSHGRRTADTIREIAPYLDAEEEDRRFEQEELEYTEGLKEVSGAAALLRHLPLERWAVVTSASRPLATLRITCACLPLPKVLVCAEDVPHGKPNPAGYLLAAQRLGVAPERCLVVEDTPSGLQAGRAAGMQLLAVTTTYSADRLLGAPSIPDFQQTRVMLTPGGIEVRFD
jgi:mannitol-1-/sugar-/sorbitol-6-phosphatase